MRVFLSLLISIVFLFTFSTNILAGGFSLESIGALDLQGTTYSHYWYTGTNATLSGTAPANSAVTIGVDGTSSSLTADASGSWSHPLSLTAGDHTIALSAASVTPYTFTLTIGEPPADIGGITAPASPSAGVGYPTIILALAGVFLLGSSMIFARKAFASK